MSFLTEGFSIEGDFQLEWNSDIFELVGPRFEIMGNFHSMYNEYSFEHKMDKATNPLFQYSMKVGLWTWQTLTIHISSFSFYFRLTGTSENVHHKKKLFVDRR